MLRRHGVSKARPFTNTEIADLRAEDRELLVNHYGSQTAAPAEPFEACGW
jgi:hypothetical protein